MTPKTPQFFSSRLPAFQFTSLMTIDIFLYDVGQYLLPVLLSLVMAQREFHGNKDPDPSRRAGYPKALSPLKHAA